MKDREEWRERVRDICASGTTWWWWFLYYFWFLYIVMQVFKDTFPICCCSIILYRCDALYIPSINLTWIKSSVIFCSSSPRFLDSQYLLAFRRRRRYFMISSSIFCFINMNIILPATTNLFLGLTFLLTIWLIFSKVRSSRFLGYAMVET